MAKPRIIVGMSGGVDSSVAAGILQAQGFDVVGVTLQLYSYEETVEEISDTKKHCHPSSFITAAQQVAQQLKIPHYVINKEDLFKETIIDPFMESYKKGHTPLPCATCNRDVKTEALYQLLPELKADGLATGHYVRTIQSEGVAQLHKGQDPLRDQSFFLFALPLHYLNILHFPLGAFSKDQTRQQAHEMGLPVSTTPSSQDLCFIAKRSYKTLFSPRQGDIYHEEGQWLGHHQGVERFTVGQRQGLSVSGYPGPLYVTALDPESNRVTVGPRSSLQQKTILLHQINWIAFDQQSPQDPDKSHRLTVKIRSSGPALAATVLLCKGFSQAIVTLDEPEYGISPGQACVFYQGTRLVGGGWISSEKPTS